jgi:GAF domain-containing protein
MRYAVATDKDAGPAAEPGRHARGKIVLYEERAHMKTEVARALRQAEAEAEMPPGLLVDALRRITRVVSGTLELREVFSRVAEITVSVLPLDFMAVMRVKGADALDLYSLSGGVKDPPYTIRPEDFSPALRPLPDRVKRIDDLAEQLEPSFAVDRKMREAGMRSSLTAPLLRGEQRAGYVMVESRRPGAFTAGHEAALQPIADLLGLALEHERL